jgi:hypothetical protein
MTDEIRGNISDTGKDPNSIPASYRPMIRNSLQRNDLKDGCVIFDKENGSVLALNITSSFYLTYCTGDYTLDQIADDTALVMGIGKEESFKNTASTIMLFQENGLLEAG